MDRLEAMSLLVTVADTGGFSAASRKLGMPLPTVSRKIAELEAHLKTRLLLRTTREADAGGSRYNFFDACKPIPTRSTTRKPRHRENTRAARRAPSAAPIVLGRLHVIPTVNEFLKRYPEINVRLSLSDKNINLLDEHVDLAVRVGALPDSGLGAIKGRCSVTARCLRQSGLFQSLWHAGETPAIWRSSHV